jgi:pseudouridine-5'-phosphate glycosidase
VSGLYRCNEAVAAALAARQPVVALETTVVTHGLPYPDGLAMAVELEETVRAHGAVPATIGILDGLVRVGMSRAELERLAQDRAAVKTNLSNFAGVLKARQPGSTTVAATMAVAHANGIRVFASGGIGGVHRGAQVTGDVSTDLIALSRVPVAVVTAGAKAILDLPRTVEMLETLGVPVVGFGTSEFPAFYRRSSGLRVDTRVDSIDGVAAIINAHFALGLGSGVLVANPIPEEDELPEDVYERALATALTDVETRGLSGREITPFLLERLRELTGGDTVRANVALLRNNARVAALVAAQVRSPSQTGSSLFIERRVHQ